MFMVVTAVFLGILGAIFGSFVDAVSWRLRTKRNFVTERSECEHCHHTLGPLDLIPIFSWLALGGKCRYCKKPITRLAPITEIVMAALFVLSFAVWPFGFETGQGIVLFVFWLVYLVMLGILFVYDLRWQLLPNVIVFPLIVLGLADAALRVSLLPDPSIATYIAHVTLGVAVMAGVYGLMYVVSKGRWVGLGDVKLAIFMGAVLGWQNMLLVLMLANCIGLLVIIPGLATKKLSRKSHIPFGPFMIAAFIIAGLFGNHIISWYLSTFVLI